MKHTSEKITRCKCISTMDSNLSTEDKVNEFKELDDIKDQEEFKTQLKSPPITENSSSSSILDFGKDDGINVALRVRPLNHYELFRKEISTVEFPGKGQIRVRSQNFNKTYSFNVCFEPEADQKHIFDHSGIKKLIDLACEGYSCTCFVYGQTGSGKTYTMSGPADEFLTKTNLNPETIGIAPRSFQLLFKMLRNRGNFRVYASYLEIYNEQVKDLLNPHPLYPLNIRWRKKRGFFVDNLFLIESENSDELLEVLQKGMKNRNFKATNPNEFSSRSHCIFTIYMDLEVIDPIDETIVYTKHGKLSFVDLAGSEKVKTDTESSQNQLQETNNINRSLLVLSNCISCLSDPKRRNSHIPFRDSKLTKLLADSLGGNGVTLMIACISPSNSSITDTSNTLRYAARALRIESNPFIKMDPKEKIIASLKREIYVLKQENIILKSQIIPNYQKNKNGDKDSLTSSKLTIRCSESPSIPIETSNTHLSLNSNQDANEGANLFEMLQEYMMENENLRGTNLQLVQTKEMISRDYESLMRENEKLAREVEKLRQEVKEFSSAQSTGIVGSNTNHSSAIIKSTMSPRISDAKDEKRRKRNSQTISMIELQNVESSYAQIYDSKKRPSNSMLTRRSFNESTKLEPLRTTPKPNIAKNNDELLQENAKINSAIEKETKIIAKLI